MFSFGKKEVNLVKRRGLINGVICPCCGQITQYIKIERIKKLRYPHKYKINKYYIECSNCQSSFELPERDFSLCKNPSDILLVIMHNCMQISSFFDSSSMEGVTPAKYCDIHAYWGTVTMCVFDKFVLCYELQFCSREPTVFVCEKDICDEVHGLLASFISSLSEHNISLFMEPAMYWYTYLIPDGSIYADWGSDTKCNIFVYHNNEENTKLIKDMLNHLLNNILILAEKYRIMLDN